MTLIQPGTAVSRPGHPFPHTALELHSKTVNVSSVTGVERSSHRVRYCTTRFVFRMLRRHDNGRWFELSLDQLVGARYVWPHVPFHTWTSLSFYDCCERGFDVSNYSHHVFKDG